MSPVRPFVVWDTNSYFYNHTRLRSLRYIKHFLPRNAAIIRKNRSIASKKCRNPIFRIQNRSSTIFNIRTFYERAPGPRLRPSVIDSTPHLKNKDHTGEQDTLRYLQDTIRYLLGCIHVVFQVVPLYHGTIGTPFINDEPFIDFVTLLAMIKNAFIRQMHQKTEWHGVGIGNPLW